MRWLLGVAALAASACLGGTDRPPLCGSDCGSGYSPIDVTITGRAVGDDGELMLDGQQLRYPTAVGGTQTFALHFTLDGAPSEVTSWEAAIGGPALRELNTGDEGDDLTLVGGSAGSADVEIIDPATGQVFDGNTLLAVDLATISFVPARTEWTSTATVAFANGSSGAVIALSGTLAGNADLTTRVVDDTMMVAAGAIPRSAWDTLDLTGLAAGDYPVTVTSAGRPFALDVAVADTPDGVTGDDASVTFGATDGVCFTAIANGRGVVGYDWSFASNGTPLPAFDDPFPNCASTASLGPAGTVQPVTATVRGVTATANVTITPAT